MVPERAQARDPQPVASCATLVHVTTVPVSLHTFLRAQARHVRGLGFDVHAISSPGSDLERFEHQEGVAVHAVRMTRQVSPANDLLALYHLWRKLRELRPTIVHAHSPKGGLLGMTAAVLAGVPVRVYHIRGLPHATSRGLRRMVLVAAERVSCRLAHRVLAVSRSMRDIAIGAGLCAPEKIRVLLGGSGNGVDAAGRFRPPTAAARAAARERLGIPAGALVVGFVGRIGRDKGIIELGAAWARLREEIPSAHLLLVGPDEREQSLPRALEDELRADPRVHLPGEVGETPPMYAAMDVVALPSYREGMPNVALEAAAMELPIVATAIPGCVDAVVDGVTGTLVPVHDAGALRRELQRYLEDPARRAAHGASARRRVLSDFGQEAVWGAIVAEYHALLAARLAPEGDPRGGPAVGGDG
jgi:glycosyltransferase involved in cell wall biosynthesis